MLLPFPLLLLLLLLTGGLSTHGGSKAVVYYVMPTVPHSSDCPGEPCKPLDYYFCKGDTYFSSSKMNVTLMLMRGKHIYTGCNGMYVSIDELETFEMIGVAPANEVIVFLRTSIQINIAASYFGNLTFTCDIRLDPALPPTVSLPGDADGKLKSKVSSYFESVNREVFVTVVNGTIFSGLLLYQYIFKDSSINFRIIVTNSTFMNEAGITGTKEADSDADLDYYVGRVEVIQCVFTNFTVYINYIHVNLTIRDSTFSIDSGSDYVMLLEYGIMFAGNVIFNVGYTTNGQILVLSSNMLISGNITFANNTQSSILAYSSTVTVSGNILFVNNTGINGGAMALYSSTLNIATNTSVYFINNTATDTGGALYVTNDKNKLPNPRYVPCFYQLLDYDDWSNNWYDIQFVNNTARNGGDHIYGEYMHSCICLAAMQMGINGREPDAIPTYCVQDSVFSYHPQSLSLVSSEPTRVCLCEKHGQQQCENFQQSVEVYPGELFTIFAVIVGADFGTTTGTIHTVLGDSTQSTLNPTSYVVDNNKLCTELNFILLSSNTYEVIYFTIKPVSLTTAQLLFSQARSKNDFCDIGSHTVCYRDVIQNNITKSSLLPQLIYIDLLPCPLGFTLLGNPPGCDCYPILTENDVTCLFENRTGYHSWNGSKWLNIDNNLTVAVTKYCPFDYCNTNTERKLNLGNSSDAQCLSNRHGTLCGACKASYSLAIGSSNCIQCSSSKSLTLIIFFGAAGLLLVLFISVVNLTVTQGMINGLTFFANIVWTYQNILLSTCDTKFNLVFLRVLLAWLDLEFGIETCFIKGLNAFWKMWLQYLFPAYIWSISGLMIISARYSTKLTKLFGNRAVSVLATLFLLSYTKLLKVIIDSVGFTPIKLFRNDSINYTLTVWSLDGNYSYCHFPHILLMVAALIVFTFMWLPYTLTLLQIQLLRRISHFNILKWIPRFNPVYDAYFAPLKDNYHHWFGVLLLVRGVLFVIFTATYTIYPSVNYILLLTSASLLLGYANYNRVYKNKVVQLSENFLLFLLVLMGGSGCLQEQKRCVIGQASVVLGILVFCGIFGCRKVLRCCCQKRKMRMEYAATEQRRIQQDHLSSTQFRDSILQETKPLLKET